jgi:DNA-binding transcriptional MerR regulator
VQLSELSARTGVPVATIKYYLREGLLPPGRRVTQTRSEYGEQHEHRLGLIRALTQLGGVSLSKTREVLAVVDDTAVSPFITLGAVHWALLGQDGHPLDGEPSEEQRSSQHLVDELLNSLEWTVWRGTPPYWRLVRAVATLRKLNYPCDLEHLQPYAKAAQDVATADIDTMFETEAGEEEQLERAVALSVLYEPVFLALRFLAQGHEAGRHFGVDPSTGQSEHPGAGQQ